MAPKKKKPKSPLYQFIDRVTKYKTELSGDEEELKQYSPYMMNRTISMSPGHLLQIRVINNYDIPKEAHYELLRCGLSTGSEFFRNINQGKSEIKTNEALSKYFKVGTVDCAEIRQGLSEAEVDEICRGMSGKF